MNMEEGSARQPVTHDAVKMLIITANVGSLFEDPENTLTLWLSEFLKSVNQKNPGFLAIHLQEIGGKNYEESMQHVNHFVKRLLACKELGLYDRGRIFLDEDFTADDKFTALGAVYFVHEQVTDVQIWDFIEKKFVTLEDKEVMSGSIENVPIKEKIKFPVHFFPDCRWSRKGYLRTRWRLYDIKFDLVNIHLFHDASNLTAMETSPSTYSEYRNRAFQYALDSIDSDELETLPYFIFGDFNFRLDTNKLVTNFGEKLSKEIKRSKKNNEITKITLKNCDKEILSVGKKSFEYHTHEALFFDDNGKDVLRYDNELKPFLSRLDEYKVNFPPTYPFSEDINDGVHYMKTRCPAWCDRILLTPSAKNLILTDAPYTEPVYHIIGHKTCMGDHKPVYLDFHMKRNDKESQNANNNTKEKARRVVSINGETVESSELEDINIHDYATFENEDDIDPQLRQTFRRKSSTNSLSFQAVAKEVMLTGGAVRKWRHRRRHHSSSASETEEDVDPFDMHTTEIIESDINGSCSTAGQIQGSIGSGEDETVCMNGDEATQSPPPTVHEQHVVLDINTNMSPGTPSSPSEPAPNMASKGSEKYWQDVNNQNAEHSVAMSDVAEGGNQNGGDSVRQQPQSSSRLHKQISAMSAAQDPGCPCRCIIM